MWTGGGFRVVLHRERGSIKASQTFDHIIVEAHMTYFHASVWRIADPIDGSINSKTVILGCDLNLAGASIHDWNVDSAMAIAKFVRTKAQGTSKDLVTEADTK